MLGISTDTISANAAFADKYGFSFPLLSDLDRSICAAYGACQRHGAEKARRITYVIGPDGSVRHFYAEQEVQIERHAQQILSAALPAPNAGMGRYQA